MTTLKRVGKADLKVGNDYLYKGLSGNYLFGTIGSSGEYFVVDISRLALSSSMHGQFYGPIELGE